jgi:hypothetical protein
MGGGGAMIIVVHFIEKEKNAQYDIVKGNLKDTKQAHGVSAFRGQGCPRSQERRS